MKNIKIKITATVDALTRQWSQQWAEDHVGQVYPAMQNEDGWAYVDSKHSNCREGKGAQFHPCLFERVDEYTPTKVRWILIDENDNPVDPQLHMKEAILDMENMLAVLKGE